MGEFLKWAQANTLEAIALLSAIGGASVGLVMAVSKAAGPVERLVRAWKSKRNGHEKTQPVPDPDTGPDALPAFFTRQEGKELEDLVRERTHRIANVAQEASGKADLVDRRQDKHSRILMDVQKEMAEHRGETRARLEAVREKQEETCQRLERVEQQQSEHGTLLKAVAKQLGVSS